VFSARSLRALRLGGFVLRRSLTAETQRARRDESLELSQEFNVSIGD